MFFLVYHTQLARTSLLIFSYLPSNKNRIYIQISNTNIFYQIIQERVIFLQSSPLFAVKKQKHRVALLSGFWHKTGT